jgi:hypothetical protein
MSDPEAPKGMKKTAKGREVSFRVRVEAAVHPIVFASDPRLPPDLLLDQPTAGSKSAQNLAKYYQNNGASIKMLVRAYIQDGSNAIRLFGPLKTEEGRPTWMGPEDDAGYQGSIPLDSPRSLAILKLFEDETETL